MEIYDIVCYSRRELQCYKGVRSCIYAERIDVCACVLAYACVCEMERLVHTVLACVNLQYSCTVYLRV